APYWSLLDSPSSPTRRSSDLPAGSARLVARHTIRHRTGRCHAPPPKSVVDGEPRRRYRTAGESSPPVGEPRCGHGPHVPSFTSRSEEHTSELQSRENLVCRLL